VPNQQHWFMLARSRKADDDVLLSLVRPADKDVLRGKTALSKALRHGFRGCSHTTHGIGGIDIDQLLENVAPKVRVSAPRLDICGRTGKKTKQYDV